VRTVKRKWFLKLLGLTAGVVIPAELFSKFIWDIKIVNGLTVVSFIEAVVWGILFSVLLLGKDT